jgi:hypothetical protein
MSSPSPPMGWMHSGDDGDQLRAAHDAALARRHAALSSGSTFVPQDPTILGQPLTFPSSSPEPPGWVGQPRPMPKTLLGAALEGASNPNPAGQPVTWVNNKGEPVTFVNDKGEPVTSVKDKDAPRDDFAEAAAEAISNPDPAEERQIFEYGVSDLTADDQSGAEAGLVHSKKGEDVQSGVWTAHGQGAVTARAQTIGRKSRRLRSAVGRSVRANNVTIILSVASLVLLIDEKLASLRDERRNDRDALSEVIAHYESLKCDLEALRDVAIEVRQGTADDKTVTKATSTFSECIRKWWNKRHDEICTKAYDATLFISCVSLCSLAGCGGATAVAVSGALIGGKPVVDALKALPKRLFKDHGQ